MADVVRVLSHHDPERVKAAAKMIMNRCRDVPANRAAYGVARAIPSLVDALRAHPDHSGVQEWVCRALCNICIGNEANRVCCSCPNINDSFFTNMMPLRVIQIAIREAGGIDLIFLASKNHITNVDVEDAVCAVLRNLTTTLSNQVFTTMLMLISITCLRCRR